MRQFKKANRTITKRSQNLNIYLNEIGRYSLLSLEEEERLAREVKSDDAYTSKRALDKLVSANLRFVVSVANQYVYTGIDFEELISAGNMGLIKAAKGFDETRGFKFISYAIWWIRQSILEFVNNENSIVRIPLNSTQLMRKYLELRKDFYQSNGIPISDDEAAELLGMETHQLVNLKKWMGPMQSLDEKVSNDNENLVSDYLPSENKTDDEINKEDLHAELMRCVNTLKPIEKDILLRSLGMNGREESYLSLAHEYGITRERVRQIRTRAVEKLRKCGNLLRPYVA